MIATSRGGSLRASIALLWTCLMSYNAANAQKFTVRVEDPTFLTILNCIDYQTHVHFEFTGNRQLLEKKVSGRFINYPLKKFLARYPRQYGLASVWTNDTTIVFTEDRSPSSQHHMLYYVCGVVTRARKDSGIILLEGVTVQVRGTKIITQTGPYGDFHFDSVAAGSTLVFTCVNVEPAEIRVRQSMSVVLKDKVARLEKITVTNGIIQDSKDYMPGSIDQVPRAALERTPYSNIFGRLQYQSPGILFTYNGQPTSGIDANNIQIRGLSSINASNRPLVIVDNFIFSGDISTINPEDIATLTILKDAASLAIWGVRAGNGVIVITTKKARTSSASITAIHTFSIQGRPDVFNYHPYPAASQIDMEIKAYQDKYYDRYFDLGSNMAPLSPVVTLLHNADAGIISRQEAASRITAMRNNDVRRDVLHYFYQSSPEQQYTIQLGRRLSRLCYFMSLGFTRAEGSLTGSAQQRYTARTQFTYAVNEKLSLSAAISYTDIISHNIGNPQFNYTSTHGNKHMPDYFNFVNDQGRPAYLYGDYSQYYIQQLITQGYPNAVYNSLLDLNHEYNRQNTSSYFVNLGLQYTFHPGLTFEAKYQFQQQRLSDNDLHTGSSFFVRDIMNQFMQRDQFGNLSSPIPPGGISNIRSQSIISNQARLQLDYRKQLNDGSHLSFTLGAEFCNIVNIGDTSFVYGVSNTTKSVAVDDSTSFPLLMSGTGQSSTIPVKGGYAKTTDRILSSFFSATYNYQDRYTLAVVFRQDIANLFGTATNNKWMPLKAISATWQASKEPFYKLRFLPELSLGASIGNLGNISRLSSADPSFTLVNGGITTPYPAAFSLNPADRNLRWENVSIYNLILSFSTIKHILSVTFEPFIKRSSSLIAPTPMDPTLGGVQSPGVRAYYFSNSAAMRTTGIDMTITSRNLSGRVGWTSSLMLSTLSSCVTGYPQPAGMGNQYLDPYLPHPALSRPLFGIYAFKTFNLDAQTGDPQGSWNGRPSRGWDTIYNNTPLDSMVYKGPSQPRVFGSLRNTFTVKDFSLSFTVSYRFGYYTRMPAFSSSDLLNSWSTYAPRMQPWLKPGDELSTIVPAIDYTGNAARDVFNAYSEPLVIRADNIRLEDITLTYEPRRPRNKDPHHVHLKVMAGITNLGPLWIGNKFHFDAFYPEIPRDKARIFGGINITF